MKILLLFTHPWNVPNLYDFLMSKKNEIIEWIYSWVNSVQKQ